MRQYTVKQALTRVGSVLRNKWTVDKLIGLGGMASVYAATHRNGNRVAIKVLHPELSMNQDARDRFLREGYAANRVGHPNAVSVLDDDETDDGAVFLVMELLDGEGLDIRMERKRTLPPTEVLFIADQVLDVLAFAHPNGIIHRDIKPANIFLSSDGRVKVLDFGLARMKEGNFSGKVTKDGMVLGTASYMPPEQAQAKRDKIDGRSDLWALGATMFHALAGRIVHHADTMTARLMAAIQNPAPSLASVAKGMPDSLVALVDRSLAYQMDNRFSDARAMQTVTRAVFQELTGEALKSVDRFAAPDAAGWVAPPSARMPDISSIDVSVTFDNGDGESMYEIPVEWSDGEKRGPAGPMTPSQLDGIPSLSESAIEDVPVGPDDDTIIDKQRK
jgi:serine/threonine protein kinase